MVVNQNDVFHGNGGPVAAEREEGRGSGPRGDPSPPPGLV
jgi:hypothetical protein